jgi:hypothetical protein
LSAPVPIPQTLHVTVTADDIEQGVPGHTSQCAIARALARQGYQSRVSGSFAILHFDGDVCARYVMPLAAREFIYAYDNKLGAPQPFEFDMMTFHVPLPAPPPPAPTEVVEVADETAEVTTSAVAHDDGLDAEIALYHADYHYMIAQHLAMLMPSPNLNQRLVAVGVG